MPLLIITGIVSNQFQDPEDVNPNLYDKHLIQREDPNTDVWLEEYHVPLITKAVFSLVIIARAVQMFKAFKKAEAKRLEWGEFNYQ